MIKAKKPAQLLKLPGVAFLLNRGHTIYSWRTEESGQIFVDSEDLGRQQWGGACCREGPTALTEVGHGQPE